MRSRSLPAVVCLLVLVCSAGESSAEASDGFLARAWRHISDAMDAAAAGNAIVPPSPVEVRWQAQKRASLELGAPLLDLDSADLDGDGRAELVLLSSRELVVVAVDDDWKTRVVARRALPDVPAAIRSRDPVGAVWIGDRDGDGRQEILARTSEQAVGLIARLGDGVLEAVGEVQGFPICDRGEMTAVPGRNYFTAGGASWWGEALTLPSELYSVSCGRELVDAGGHRIEVYAAVSTRGALTVGCRGGERARCEAPAASGAIDEVGTAHVVVDIDSDGSPEVVVAGRGVPGTRDRVAVISRRGEVDERIFEHVFTGGIAGLGASDIDGDGAQEIVAAVRLAGATRIGLWTLNR